MLTPRFASIESAGEAPASDGAAQPKTPRCSMPIPGR